MREEKIFDVNWEGERNISENPQAFKMYSYPPGTIRNMSVPGFIIWLVLVAWIHRRVRIWSMDVDNRRL